MKNLFKKLPLTGKPAQEMFFAVTLWLFWLYAAFLISLWEMAETNSDSDVGEFAAKLIPGISWVLSAYLITAMIIFYYQSCRATAWQKYTLGVISGVCIALAINTGESTLGNTLLLLIAGCWLLPGLLIGKIRWYTYCLHALAWTGGAFILAAIHCKFWAEAEMYFERKHTFFDMNYEPEIAKMFHISGDGWVRLSLLGLLLLLGGYLLTAKIASAAAAIKLRQIVTRKIMVLWGLSTLFYLVFSAMALMAGHQIKQNEERLAQRFGRPVSAPALGQLYYGKDLPDRRYWQTVESLVDKCRMDDDYSIDYDLDPATAPPDFWNNFAKFKDDLARWEQAFSGPIPPDERDFRPGKLLYYEHFNSYFFRRFEYLEIWQIYLALHNHDLKGALAVYWRIKHVNDFLLRDACNDNGYRWISCENIRLDALQLLLESNELTMADLQILAADLRTVKEQLPVAFEHGLYTKIVNERDEFISFGQGGPLYMAKIITLPLKKLRFYYPLIWWQVNEHIKEQLADLGSGKFAPGVLPPSKYTKSYFQLLLRLRAAQTVIRAVEYQKQHGEYPKTLDDLPANPFTGKPLQYRVGDCEIKIQTAVKDKNTWYYTNGLPQTVPAIRCWGLEPDRQYPIDFTVRIKP